MAAYGCSLFLPTSELIYFSTCETLHTGHEALKRSWSLLIPVYISFCFYFLIYFYTVSHLFILFNCVPKRKERERQRERENDSAANSTRAISCKPVLNPSTWFLLSRSALPLLHPTISPSPEVVSDTFMSLFVVSSSFVAPAVPASLKKSPFVMKSEIFIRRLNIFQEDCQEHGSTEQNWPAK